MNDLWNLYHHSMAEGEGDQSVYELHNTDGGDVVDLKVCTEDGLTASQRLFEIQDLPKRVRMIIWSFLDFSSLKCVSETCTKFHRDILPLSLCRELFSPFHDFIYAIPFLPLRKYLDKESIKNLRLVCSNLKTSMDLCFGTPGEWDRWGLEARFSYSEKASWGTMQLRKAFESETSRKSSRKAKVVTTIYDLQTQDLKRILSYLFDADLNSLESVNEIFRRLVGEIRLYPFQEYQDNLEQVNLMDLPSEIHTHLLNYCRPKDRTNLRLVSKLMQYQVDTLAGVQVHLNDMKWSWDRDCGKLPPAYSLIVANIENIQSINYFLSEYNCMLLTRLVVDGPFPANAMVGVLDKCRNLRYIGLTFATCMTSLKDEMSLQKRRTPLKLVGLRAINLKIQDTELPTNNIFRVHAWTWSNAFEFMRPTLFLMPNLTSFYLCEDSIFSHNLLFETADKVLKFIVEHRHTLKYISVTLLGHCFRSCVCPTYISQVSEKDLGELRLAKYCHDCDWRISRPFTAILRAQKNLRELSCYKLSDWEFYARAIRLNGSTLQSVTIEKNLAPVIDLSVFECCTSLRHLWISQCGNLGHSYDSSRNSCQIRSMRFDPRLANLDKLPVSLTRLQILDQTAETSQIQSIPRRLKNLEILELQFLGSWNGSSFGMTTTMLSEILHLRKLECLFLEEMSTMVTYCPLQDIIAEVNLIPAECSQIVKCFGCVMYGALVAKSLPTFEFMPEWRRRVSHYFDEAFSDNRADYDIMDAWDEVEGEEED